MSSPDGSPMQPAWGPPPNHGGGHSPPVTQGELQAALQNLWEYVLEQTEQITQLGEKMSASQADIDTLTAALAQEDSDLNSAVAGIQAEIKALQTANPSVDVTALSAQVDALKTAVSAAAALVPAAPPAAPSA